MERSIEIEELVGAWFSAATKGDPSLVVAHVSLSDATRLIGSDPSEVFKGGAAACDDCHAGRQACLAGLECCVPPRGRDLEVRSDPRLDRGAERPDRLDLPRRRCRVAPTPSCSASRRAAVPAARARRPRVVGRRRRGVQEHRGSGSIHPLLLEAPGGQWSHPHRASVAGGDDHPAGRSVPTCTPL
jgi:hypothetical protein